MRLEALSVLNLPKKSMEKRFVPVEPSYVPAFVVDTCQRSLWVFNSEAYCPSEIRGAEVYKGQEAYRFLLQVATGLASEVVGETDIFGQIKEAWRKVTQRVEDQNVILDLSP